MTLLEKIPADDLIFVVNCKKPKNLSQKYNPDQINKIFNVAKQLCKFKLRGSKVSQAMFSVLTDTLTYSTVLLWTMVGLISFSLMPLAIITGVLLLTGVVAAGFDFFSTYFKLKKEDEKTDKHLQFRQLQIACYDELILRKRKSGPSLNQNVPINKSSVAGKTHKNTLSCLNQSMKSTLFMTTTLFGTYYAGMIAITAAFGLSTVAAAMLGPIGIGVAVGISVGIGLYFGYKYYQANQSAKRLKREQVSVEDELEMKEKEYLELNEVMQNRPKPKPKCHHPEEKKHAFNQNKKNYTSANNHHIFTRRNKLIVGHRIQWPQFNRAI